MSTKQRKKDFPCLKCEIHVKKNDCAIQCQLCDLWIHQKCAEMSDVLFKELVFQIENGGGAFWSCKSCRAATAKLNKKITEIYKKVEELETETKDNRIEIQTVKADLADTNRRIDKLSENSRDKEAASHDAVFRELKDREERKNNLLIHNLEEPGPEVRLGKERKEIDIKSLMKVMETINIRINMDVDVKYVRRLGEKKDSTRPLLVGLTDPSTRVAILNNAAKLANTQFSTISLVPDLTKRQRDEDEEVRKICETRNGERSGEDLNFIWKPLGPRGSRRPVKTRIQREQERTTRPTRPNPRVRNLSPEKEKGSRRMSEKRGREDTEDTEDEEEQRRTRRMSKMRGREDTEDDVSSQQQETRISKH